MHIHKTRRTQHGHVHPCPTLGRGLA